MKLNCVWYVSGFKQPWEADVISNLAEALRSRGASLQVYVKGGTAHFHAEGVMSWNALTFAERMKTVLFGRRKLWHLWGDAPFWWPIVRLRSRTVHTSLSAKPSWRGHPTRLFKEQAKDGENRIVPTFEPKAAWADFSSVCGEPDGAVLLLACGDNAAARENILKAWESFSQEAGEASKGSSILAADNAPASALQAAYMTMRGVPVAAPESPLVRELLGPGGYVGVLQAGGKPEWEEAFRFAASDAGRSASAAARRFLKENYGAAAAAESLENLYEVVGRGKI